MHLSVANSPHPSIISGGGCGLVIKVIKQFILKKPYLIKLLHLEHMLHWLQNKVYQL